MSENNLVEVATSHKTIIREVCSSGWTLSYPEWVRDTFTRALKTDVLPEYAVRQVNKALGAARAINRRMDKQAEEAAKESTKVKKGSQHNSRKAEKRARDREIRMRMKGAKK